MIARSPLTIATLAPWLESLRELSAEESTASCAVESFENLVSRWQALQIPPGELVVLAMPSTAMAMRLFLAVLATGGVPVLVTPGLPPSRLRNLLEELTARVLVAPRLDASAFPHEAFEELGGAEVLVLQPSGAAQTRPGEVVLLTSGTSGFASGCVFPFASLLENARRHAEAIDLQADDVMFITLPLYFSYALVAQFLAALVVGCRVVISGPPFHAPSYLRHVAEQQITVSALTPLLVRGLLNQKAGWPESLRKLTVGGDQLSGQHVAWLLGTRPGQELFITYGLTEAGPRVATLPAHRVSESQYAAVGWALRDTRALLEPVPEHSGDFQLLVESSTVMDRRIGLVEAKRDTLRRAGLVATGDIFTQDDTGCLFFKRRLSDFILRQGEKLCLASVRRIVAALPGVLAVRTELVLHEGEPDFDLQVTLSEAGVMERNVFERKLRSLLRRSEMPRELHLLSAAQTAAHK